ncbi:hypothetical protein [Jiangella asiatica]|nr:hypothetical protein [Jiangella asiatica]
MATQALVRRTGLVARWVMVTDISGHERTELRWVVAPAEADTRRGSVRAA